MTVIVRRTIAACSLLFVAGCVTDELAVYKESVLNKDAMKPYLGVYQVEQWPGDMKPDTIRAAEKDGKYSFSYSLADKRVKLEFVVSKIPNSKKDLHLLSIPEQKDTNQANMFFVGGVREGKTHIWVVFSNKPVAKGRLEFKGGKAKAEDVKKFLAKHADAFVTENEPPVTLVKQRG